MSLSKQIIYGTDEQVSNFLRDGANLDLIDEYGYTPLTQAAIVNSPSKAKLLLDAGAKVDFTDLTGRTPLFWAADNGNTELAKLLLKHGAEANSYTLAGQPTLVMPLLRQQKAMIKLLRKNGAKLTFAQDFINAKLLGHRYELEGRVDIVDHTNTFIETELEGFYLEFTLSVIAKSLDEYRRNYAGKHLRKLFPYVDLTVEALRNAANLMRYQHYLIDIQHYKRQIDSLLARDVLVLPIAFAGHAITFIRFGGLLIRCDRGEFGRKHGTVIFYHMRQPHKLNSILIKQLLYRRQSEEFVNSNLVNLLHAEPVLQLPLLPQKAGNCSWANVEAVVPTLLLTLLLDQHGIDAQESCQQEAMAFYQEWIAWERERELFFALQNFREADSRRKAAIATLLAAILFQTCDYERPADHQRAEKILRLLDNPHYKYVLESYIRVFSQDKNNRGLFNLRNFMQDFGIVID